MSRQVPRTSWRDASRRAVEPSSGNGLDHVPAASNPTVERALEHAERGWRVFPCRPASKEPATRHGFHDATTEPDEIRDWWQHWPDANLAIATGAPGPDVLDVDNHGRHGHGYGALLQLKRADLLDTSGAVVRTPHGGLHIYFSGTSQLSGRLAAHHLDFKASGGYVVAPPSQVDGRPYYQVRDCEPSGELSWVRVTGILEPRHDRPTRPARISSDPSGLAAWVERLEEGNRNAGLFWAACRAAESGQPNVLDDIAAAAARTGLSEREISRTIDSAQRLSPPQPGSRADREAT